MPRLLGVLGALLAAASAAPAAEPPPLAGILLVTVDTLRADHVGAYGGPVPTPAFDGVAAEGVLVEAAFTPTPSTAPAHASLLTGLHPWRHGVLDNAVALDARHPTLAERLRERGFETAAFVSSYILHPRFALDRGFDRYQLLGGESYRWRGALRRDFWARGDAVSDAALDWLARKVERGGGPFFLWLHYFDPHTPYDPPAGFGVAPDVAISLDGKRVPPGVRSAEELRRLVRAYRGDVRFADAQIGRVLEQLRRLGIDARTAVVLTSDHGEGLGDHGVLEHGENVYDELVRVPLVVRAPGLPAGRRLAGLAQLEDLAPTLLAFAGAPAPPGLDGADLLPWLRGDSPRSPRELVLGRRKAARGKPDLFFARDLGEKWIGVPSAPGVRHVLRTDPRELEPVAGAAAPAPLRALFSAAAQPGRTPAGPPAAEIDPEVRRALEALGYAD